jgi:hypothetical protein
MRTLLPLLLLGACAPGVISLDGDSTASDPTADTDGNGDTDTDTTGGDDTADAEPVPDLSVWNGTRRFYYDYSQYGYECDQTVGESGTAIDPGTADYDALSELCHDCDTFYAVTPDADQVCDYLPLVAGWRGVTFGDGHASVHLYYEQNGELVEYAGDEDADFDGSLLGYGYETTYYGYLTIEVTGTVTFPLVAP